MDFPVQLMERLQSAPWRFGFLPLLRQINANCARDPVGAAQRPGAEPYRIGQKPSLVFAPREVADAKLRNGKLHIRLFGLGMLGPNGPLPIHVTEIAREREEQRHDPTLCNFLDIFHHRSLTLLYRAWASAQSAASLDRPEHDRFSAYTASFSGHAQRRGRAPLLPEHARLSAAPHLVGESRDPSALCNAVAHHFGVPVSIEEYAAHWIVLPPELHCRLGHSNAAACLGGGALLGERAPDRRHRFCMTIGPLEIETYHRFTPRGDDLLRLIEWVRVYVGLEFEWMLELQIEPHSAPAAVLGGSQQLGWSSWLGESRSNAPITGMRFEPEQYRRQLRAKGGRRVDESTRRPRVGVNGK
ncbi:MULTISPECIES: type VI secretion system baseplate subunit TssG [unclassified Caballeronia]|uniref:type VI secretion system baseplate subunit TssG n=1 Tax=unclassified Caballeronia TaxID=2646786 RepID=UPI002865B4A9|nr:MULTISPECIES: type VI secretion system baseplate subunit TssG [unclassified Caballeronia]MDR5740749.1 type VI secretion system baseplate subunit TssG [Caballeronia sp. LZ016]MDR5808728.1 type VI secretion system baseplate subunit TssG [Caballeronia sp. LZ019]